MNESEAENEYLEREWRETLEYWSKNTKIDTGRELELLLKAIELATRPKSKKYAKKNKKQSYYNPAYRTSFYNSYKQLCVVKCSYVANSIEKNKNFLRNYIVQKDKPEVKNKPTLFNEDEDIVSEQILRHYEEVDVDKLFFRIILSPKRQDVPLKVLVRLFIKTVEDMTGYKLNWFAAEHYDTLNEHSHILINGRDKTGKKVHFEKAYFRSFFREIARDVCTGLVGYRTDYDIQQDREDMLRLTRWTRMDINIDNIKIQNNLCDAEYPFYIKAQNSRMHKRLLFLTKIKYAKKIGTGEYPGKFLLKKDWKDKLRYQFGYDTFLALKEQILRDENVELQMYKPGIREIEGRVTRLISETYDCEDHNGIIIDATDGTKWYLPFRQEASRKLLYQKITISREGKLINREKAPSPKVQNVIQQNKNKTVNKPDKSYDIGI